MKKIIALLLIITYSTAVFSHSGGTDSNGCHTDSSTGIYHCHNDSSSSSGSSEAAAAGVLAILLVTFLFRGGVQQVTSEPNKNEKRNKPTTIPFAQQRVNNQ